MNTPRIPDEVMREIEAMGNRLVDASQYYVEEAIEAFYLKGREDMAREIVEWLRNEPPLPMKLYEAQFWADEIESQFLPKREEKK